MWQNATEDIHKVELSVLTEILSHNILKSSHHLCWSITLLRWRMEMRITLSVYQHSGRENKWKCSISVHVRLFVSVCVFAHSHNLVKSMAMSFRITVACCIFKHTSYSQDTQKALLCNGAQQYIIVQSTIPKIWHTWWILGWWGELQQKQE